MKLWSYWLPDVLPHLAGCPVPIVIFELRRTAQEFFAATRAWQVTLATIPVTAGATGITVATPSDQEMVRIEAAFYDGIPLAVETSASMDRRFYSDWRTHTGTPEALVQFTPGTVALYPIPIANAATGLKLRVSVRPSDASTGLDDEMVVRFREDIQTGAKARLMSYVGKSWTDMQMAAVYMQRFNGMMETANVEAARSYGKGRIASTPRWH